MFCKYCGAKLESDSVFCSACGAKLSKSPVAAPAAKLTKSFDFSGFSFNEGSVREINEWLRENPIAIDSISMVNVMNNNLPLKWETIISHMDIQYSESPNAHPYQFGYFTSLCWIGSNFQKVSSKFEAWKAENPDKTVVWSALRGHQCNGGSTQTVYFLYY